MTIKETLSDFSGVESTLFSNFTALLILARNCKGRLALEWLSFIMAWEIHGKRNLDSVDFMSVTHISTWYMPDNIEVAKNFLQVFL